MFVIADIEWITNADGGLSPTQLSAARVNERWEAIEEFNTLIHPRTEEFHTWDHVAYTGGRAVDFLRAPYVEEVINNFCLWLRSEDILLWWHQDSEMVFRKLTDEYVKTSTSVRAISIRKHVYTFLVGQPNSHGSPYGIAKTRGIAIHSPLKHCSQNDVRVLRELLQVLAYPQHHLLIPQKKAVMPFHYQYDPKTNRVHSSECVQIIGVPTKGYETLKKPIRKGYIPCSCCKSTYMEALKERNIDTIRRTEYTYIYAPNSPIFHRHTCHTMLSAKNILGTRHYETVIATGRMPCKICNPTPYDPQRPLLQPQSEKSSKKSPANTLSKEVERAIKRQKFASSERERRLQQSNLTEREREDVYTLTQPRFAFWNGRGYQSFHLRSCPKLNGLENLTGFGTYQEAIDAGYTPCRRCKPTVKHNVKFSIPITNRTRKGEKAEDLDILCAHAKFAHRREDTYYYIETSVGKWRINVMTSPIKLEHINLVQTPNCETYHTQPRLFLSLLDTFEYIKRHDTTLAERTKGSSV